MGTRICTKTLWIITVSLVIRSEAKDDQWQQKIPIKFLKLFMNQQTLCESATDYDSCEYSFSNTPGKSRVFNDLYEYNSEETNIERFVSDLTTVEEKRDHSRAGCDCQLSSTLIDLGPNSFPRHIRNVTCDEHRRCHHSRGRGLHCQPIRYQVSVITLRNYLVDPSEVTDTPVLPRQLRCCWKPSQISTVVGCVCGPQNY